MIISAILAIAFAMVAWARIIRTMKLETEVGEYREANERQLKIIAELQHRLALYNEVADYDEDDEDELDPDDEAYVYESLGAALPKSVADRLQERQDVFDAIIADLEDPE